MAAYCICQIKGKPSSVFQTAVAVGTGEPSWAHQEQVVGFVSGDVLYFLIVSRNAPPKNDVVVGEAELTSMNLLSEGFDGELQLSSAGRSLGATLRVVVEATSIVGQVTQVEPVLEAPERTPEPLVHMAPELRQKVLVRVAPM